MATSTHHGRGMASPLLAARILMKSQVDQDTHLESVRHHYRLRINLNTCLPRRRGRAMPGPPRFVRAPPWRPSCARRDDGKIPGTPTHLAATLTPRKQTGITHSCDSTPEILGTPTRRPRFFPSRGDPLGRPQAPSAQSPPPRNKTRISHKDIRSVLQTLGRISHGAVNSMR